MGDIGSKARANSNMKGPLGLVSYDRIGDKRSRAVKSSLEKEIASLAGANFGNGAIGHITSGDVDPGDYGWTAENGKYSNSGRHNHNLGADVQFTDPATGKTVNLSRDAIARNDIAMAFAADNPRAGIGFGYMGPNTMHLDKSGIWQGDDNVWGGGFTSVSSPSYTSDLDNVQFARDTGIGPTPRLDAPTPTASPGPNSGFVDYSGGGISAYGLDTATNRYDSPKEKNAKSLSKSVAESAAASAGKSLRSEATEAAKDASKSKDKNKDSDKNTKDTANRNSDHDSGNKSDKSDRSDKSEKNDKSSKSDKSSASKESSKASKESKGKDHSKGGHYAD